MTHPRPTIPETVNAVWHRSISDIDRTDWDRLCGPSVSPFLEWDWLHLLEDSGSANQDTGWLPLHLTLSHQDHIIAAAPLYLRFDSTGEFVFDQIWANVALRLGLPYYPKLVGMSPFTPAAGYTFLTDPTFNQHLLQEALFATLADFSEHNALHSLAFNFIDPAWKPELESRGYSLWEHQGFVWKNANYGHFDDFLSNLKPNRRKTIRRERKSLLNAGITTQVLQGDEITPEVLDWMYEVYVNTNDKFGRFSCKFLTKKFFDGLLGPVRRHLLFVVARQNNNARPIAMALLAHKNGILYGRYWGTFEHIPFLHFEVCYYTPIEWAIANGLHTFDPGMGGEHKTLRGFLSTTNYSAHLLLDSRMREIMRINMDKVNSLEREHIEALNELLPYKEDEEHQGTDRE
ncbi:GNAT family N-acetyltransferase [Desulfovibrio inopinatus]|uniref:GNAT family N-acetyltransferase n=1 Tax=Desulfovibrio inopinatus TaxID=102109 RepID=UPI00041B3A53|nr:GNAT family N-acetyltransferase [Desulfovibrio inopinatus]